MLQQRSPNCTDPGPVPLQRSPRPARRIECPSLSLVASAHARGAVRVPQQHPFDQPAHGPRAPKTPSWIPVSRARATHWPHRCPGPSPRVPLTAASSTGPASPAPIPVHRSCPCVADCLRSAEAISCLPPRMHLPRRNTAEIWTTTWLPNNPPTARPTARPHRRRPTATPTPVQRTP